MKGETEVDFQVRNPRAEIRHLSQLEEGCLAAYLFDLTSLWSSSFSYHSHTTPIFFLSIHSAVRIPSDRNWTFFSLVRPLLPPSTRARARHPQLCFTRWILPTHCYTNLKRLSDCIHKPKTRFWPPQFPTHTRFTDPRPPCLSHLSSQTSPSRMAVVSAPNADHSSRGPCHTPVQRPPALAYRATFQVNFTADIVTHLLERGKQKDS